jgi:cytochrome c-type biogenesis protein CcmH
MALRVSYALMAVVLIGALAIGARGDGTPRTDAERANALAETIRCPTCRSQSAAQSDTVAATAVRAEIARRIAAGETDGQIRRYFSSRYGEEILLTPRASGLTGLVWILPVVALVLAAAGLTVAFRRWRRWTV